VRWNGGGFGGGGNNMRVRVRASLCQAFSRSVSNDTLFPKVVRFEWNGVVFGQSGVKWWMKGRAGNCKGPQDTILSQYLGADTICIAIR
jgi:hypothetical protein